MKPQKKPQNSISQAAQFLNKRLVEVALNYDEESRNVIRAGYRYMIECFGARDVDPKFTRDVESLEAMLFSFVSHCSDPEALAQLNTHLAPVRDVGGTVQ